MFSLKIVSFPLNCTLVRKITGFPHHKSKEASKVMRVMKSTKVQTSQTDGRCVYNLQVHKKGLNKFEVEKSLPDSITCHNPWSTLL